MCLAGKTGIELWDLRSAELISNFKLDELPEKIYFTSKAGAVLLIGSDGNGKCLTNNQGNLSLAYNFNGSHKYSDMW